MATKKKVSPVADYIAKQAAGPLEAKANKWAIYGLVALLLAAIGSWGAREYHLRQTNASRQAKLDKVESMLEESLTELNQVTQAKLSLQEQLLMERSSHSKSSSGRTILRPDGSQEEEWSTSESTIQESLQRASKEVDELSSTLKMTKDELFQETRNVHSLTAEVSTLKEELVKRSHQPWSIGAGVTMGDWSPYAGVGYIAEVAGVEVSAEGSMTLPPVARVYGVVLDPNPVYMLGIRLRP